MVRVRVLGEDDEPARVVRPIAQGVKVERAPQRRRLRGSLDPREGIAVARTPPSLHDVHLTRLSGGETVHRKGDGIHADPPRETASPERRTVSDLADDDTVTRVGKETNERDGDRVCEKHRT